MYVYKFIHLYTAKYLYIARVDNIIYAGRVRIHIRYYLLYTRQCMGINEFNNTTIPETEDRCRFRIFKIKLYTDTQSSGRERVGGRFARQH